jgi:hypothetical protein
MTGLFAGGSRERLKTPTWIVTHELKPLKMREDKVSPKLRREGLYSEVRKSL